MNIVVKFNLILIVIFFVALLTYTSYNNIKIQFKHNKISSEFETDFNFLVLFPSIHFNSHKENFVVEFEFLFWGWYVIFKQN